MVKYLIAGVCTLSALVFPQYFFGGIIWMALNLGGWVLQLHDFLGVPVQ